MRFFPALYRFCLGPPLIVFKSHTKAEPHTGEATWLRPQSVAKMAMPRRHRTLYLDLSIRHTLIHLSHQAEEVSLGNPILSAPPTVSPGVQGGACAGASQVSAPDSPPQTWG